MLKPFTALVGCCTLFLVGTSPAHAETIKPGLWEITSENQMEGMRMPAMPKLSADQMAKMKSMGITMPAQGPNGGMTTTIRHCVTPEQAARDVPPTSKDDARCKQKNVKRSGNTLSWEMECTGDHPATGSGTVTWNGSDAYAGTTTITTKDPNRGPMTMNMRFSGKLLSASCAQK